LKNCKLVLDGNPYISLGWSKHKLLDWKQQFVLLVYGLENISPIVCSSAVRLMWFWFLLVWFDFVWFDPIYLISVSLDLFELVWFLICFGSVLFGFRWFEYIESREYSHLKIWIWWGNTHIWIWWVNTHKLKIWIRWGNTHNLKI
jgi:hypothetical protein